jgi:hypothetical protein
LTVIETAKNGYQWLEPPYTAAERLHVERTINGTPRAMYGRRRETPDTGSQSLAAEGSAEADRDKSEGS